MEAFRTNITLLAITFSSILFGQNSSVCTSDLTLIKSEIDRFEFKIWIDDEDGIAYYPEVLSSSLNGDFLTSTFKVRHGNSYVEGVSLFFAELPSRKKRFKKGTRIKIIGDKIEPKDGIYILNFDIENYAIVMIDHYCSSYSLWIFIKCEL